MADTHSYATRIDATNFALANDDGRWCATTSAPTSF